MWDMICEYKDHIELIDFHDPTSHRSLILKATVEGRFLHLNVNIKFWQHVVIDIN